MKIAVVGAGYVGLSLALLLSQKNEVVVLDISKDKINKINNKVSPIKDIEFESFFKTKKLNLIATTSSKVAYKNADFIIICVPTNYNETENNFDTKPIENIIKQIISINQQSTIIIKSTVPVGFTEKIIKKYSYYNIFFSPEFLREGKAIYDNMYPSRIIVGTFLNNIKLLKKANLVANLLKSVSVKKNIKTKIINTSEAETIKLFSNAYLALRVSFFNELDTYSIKNNMNVKSIIDLLCLDNRIGNFYNNPSFGYGGYCLPKDTKQLLKSYNKIPQNIITAIVNSNKTRKQFIANDIILKKPKIVGIYRLTMKSNSNNFRESAIQDIIKILQEKNIKVVIYEPILTKQKFLNSKVINNITKFKKISNIILANRYNTELDDVKNKVYTRDLYFRD